MIATRAVQRPQQPSMKEGAHAGREVTEDLWASGISTLSNCLLAQGLGTYLGTYEQPRISTLSTTMRSHVCAWAQHTC